MNESERAKRDELQLIAARELASLAGCVLLLLLLHPGVHRWAEHQAWRMRQLANRKKVAEDAAVAELYRAISAYEHGQAQL